MRKIALGILITASFSLTLKAQNIGINGDGSAPDNSAILDVKSADKGVLIPRVQLDDASTTAPVTSPVEGLMVYNETGSEAKGFWYWSGTEWVNLTTGNSGGLVGNILSYGGVTVPTGFLVCDGNAVNRATYPDLFTAIGTVWGVGDGSTTFNLPDLRGRFMRGIDAGAGNDPDAAVRTANNGGSSGDNVGSYQDDAFQGHFHNMGYGLGITPGPSGPSINGGSSAGTTNNVKEPITDGLNGTPRTSMETRPINANVQFIIQYLPGAGSSSGGGAPQTLSVVGTNLSISNGNTVALPLDTDTHIDSTGIAALGFVAGVKEINDLSDGKTNTTSVFLGTNAGANDDETMGMNPLNHHNVAIGEEAFSLPVASENNVAIGYNALHVGGGNSSVAIGYNSLANVTGYANTAVGELTLQNATTGYANTAIGRNAMYDHISGYSNVAIGHVALIGNTTGNSNIAIGEEALRGSTGNKNVAIGDDALHGAAGSGNVAIGNEAGSGVLGGSSNKLYIENSNSSTPLIYGDFSNDSVKIYGTLSIGNNYTFPTTDGTANQVMQTNGSGVLSWATISGGSGAFSTTSNVTSNSPGTYASDDFVFGSSQLADDGDATHDNRMFFDKSKGAFRAGSTQSTEWDNDSVGFYSVALGLNTKALGAYSVVMGYKAIASGSYSFAMGNFTKATGGSSTALGGYSTASGGRSVAMGNDTKAIGINSTSMGDQTIASGFTSIAMGRYTIASGNFSTAMGLGTTAKSYSETSIGTYNTDYTSNSVNSFDAADRLFVIGNGTASGSESNALTIYKNGKMNINDAYDMPTADGTANQVMQTDGSGVVSWASSSDPVEAWQIPTLSSGWGHVGAGWATAGYYKDRDRVYLRGTFVIGSGIVIFTLPAGYRPTGIVNFSVPTVSGGTGRVDVYPNGEVKIVAGSAHISVDGISFRIN